MVVPRVDFHGNILSCTGEKIGHVSFPGFVYCPYSIEILPGYWSGNTRVSLSEIRHLDCWSEDGVYYEDAIIGTSTIFQGWTFTRLKIRQKSTRETFFIEDLPYTVTPPVIPQP